MSKIENNFYSGIHPEDQERIREVSEKLRESLISFGLSVKPLVDEAVKVICELEDLGYTMMENAYINKFGKLPDATRETQKEMVMEWFLMEETE